MPNNNFQEFNENDSYIHIYNKGVENRNLFTNEQDYQVFLNYLKEYLTAPPGSEKTKKSFSVNGRTFQGVPHQPKNYFNKVELMAYSLLPDHFHLLVNQITTDSLEKLIRSLCTRYAIYYNKKYKHSGSLLSGPYKSIKIMNASQLLHLTRYLHREPFERKESGKDLTDNGHSSYKEYLGERASSWINSKVVLSYFNEAIANAFVDKPENNYLNAIDNYKNFVEKYELDQNEKDMLERIIIESISLYTKTYANLKDTNHLEKRNLKIKSVRSFKETRPDPIPEPRSKLPEFITATTALFILLLALGVRNIKTPVAQTDNAIVFPPLLEHGASLLKESGIPNLIYLRTKVKNFLKTEISSIPSPTPQVSGIKDTILEAKDTTKEDVNPKPAGILVIKINDGSESVNIREKPTTKSEIVGKAKNGDTFEFISKEGGWYQIKSDNNTSVFISARYAEKLEGDN